MTSHILCENCLTDDAKPVSVGPELGNQRDNYRDNLMLCVDCKTLLLAHNFYGFSSRFRLERTITNTVT